MKLNQPGWQSFSNDDASLDRFPRLQKGGREVCGRRSGETQPDRETEQIMNGPLRKIHAKLMVASFNRSGHGT
jgi:hypothetical protein